MEFGNMENFSYIETKNMYTLYHIPARKEWGCTKGLNRRLKDLGYTMSDVVETIEVSDFNRAAELEKKLNIQYGYGWNKSQDYRRVTKMGLVGASIGALKRKGGKCYKPLVPVLVYDKNNKFIGEFPSVKEAAYMLHISTSGISNVLKNKRKSIHGYLIKYKS